MNMFVLKSVMLKGDTQIKLLKIDVSDKNLYKPGENIDIGTGLNCMFLLTKDHQNSKNAL